MTGQRASLIALCAAMALAAVSRPASAQPVAAEAAADADESADARVARIARRLLIANLRECPRQRWDFGFNAHRDRLPGLAGPAPAPGDPTEPAGFRVTQVVPLSPAARGGVRRGDQLMAVNGEDWASLAFATAFLRAEHGDARVRQLTLTLDRAGTPVTVTLAGELACAIPVRLVPQVRLNASAGSGMAFINSGLEQALPQDDQLAAVMAHEIAHVMLGHSKRGATSDDRARMEREADALGVRLALRAGFDPDGAARATEVVGGRARGPITRLLGLYGDHMPTPERKRFLLERSAAARLEQRAAAEAAATPAQP